MYLFVKPASDITTNGEIMISLSIVTINIAFFLYAALLLYRSFKEYAVEKLYTTGETDAETQRIQAHLAALTDEQRDKIERVEQQRREAAEEGQIERRRGSVVGTSGGGGSDPNDGGIEMVNRRRASLAMFGVNVDSASAASLPSVIAHRGTTARIGRRLSSVSGSQTAADITAHMQPSGFATAARTRNGSVSMGIELTSIARVPAAAVTLESVVCEGDDASSSPTTKGSYGADTLESPLPPIAVDRDGYISVEAALTHARPLDLVAFVDRRVASNSGGAALLQWTHVGVVVNAELLGGGIVNGRAGELYVLEAVRAVASGDGKDEPCNVETGTRTDGVQIRSLREVYHFHFHNSQDICF